MLILRAAVVFTAASIFCRFYFLFFSFPLQRPHYLNESQSVAVIFDPIVQEMASAQLAAWKLTMVEIHYSPCHSPGRDGNFKTCLEWMKC